MSETQGYWSTPLGYKTYEHLISRKHHAESCLLNMISEAMEIMADESGEPMSAAERGKKGDHGKGR